MSHVWVGPSSTSLGSLVAARPAAVKVLVRHRIDFWRDAGRAVADACAEAGLSPRSLLAELAHEEASSQPDWDWSRSSLATIVAMIVEGWHRPIEETLARAQRVADKLLQGARDARLLELRAVVVALREDLGPHFRKEECYLFPLILEGRGRSPEVRAALAHHDDAPVAELTQRMRALTDDFEPSPGGVRLQGELWSLLASVATSLFEHIALEGNVLYPRALSGEDPRLTPIVPAMAMGTAYQA